MPPTDTTRRAALQFTAAAALGAALPLRVAARDAIDASAAAAPPGTAGEVAGKDAASQAAARLRALIEASDAAAERLEPMPRDPASRAAGAPVFVDPLGDACRDAQRRNAEADATGLASIDPAVLPPVERIAWQVFDWRTQRELARHRDGVARIQQLVPLNASFGLHLELPDYVAGAGAPFASVADYEVGLRRLTGFAGYLDSMVARLEEGVAAGYLQPQVIVRQVAAQSRAMLELPAAQSPLLACLARLPPSFDAATRARFESAYRDTVEREVLPAYARLRDYLETRYLPRAPGLPGRGGLRDGARVYGWELQQHTTLSTTPRELHATGLAEVARIRAAMEAVRRELRFDGDLASLFEHVRTDPRFYFSRPEDLLERMASIEARIWAGIPRLFVRRPRAPFQVRALPSIGGQRGTGYYKPGPPDGVTPGVLWFNMAMLRTRPIPTLETLTLHEGIPGHHFQITLALEDPRLPPILRFGGLTAYSEGWGLYAESLGRELGMFTDPWQWFGHLDMEMLRAVRLVVDTGLHAFDWPRQRAIDYMLANTSMAPRDVEVEIDRYISQPGQACAYKTGELKIRELRERAQRTQAGRFDVRAFHGQVLDTGALPLAVLEDKVRRWSDAPPA
ncbi:MAG: DUF885 domain-containing protein [Steroidobacteraceae bacterium]